MNDSPPSARRPLADHVLEMPRAARAFIARQLRMPLKPALILLAILGVSLLLRVPGIDRHPMMKFESLYQDERKIINNTLEVMRGRNILEHYPLALYYWLEPQFRLAKLVTFWIEDVPDGRWLRRDADFALHVAANPVPYYALARANMVFFSMGIVLLLFMIARELAGIGPALAVAALAGVMPLFVLYAKMAYYDLPMTFWFVGTSCVIYWTWAHGSLSGVYWSAALLAWTVCSKQNGVALAPICFVTIVKVVAERSGRPWWNAWRSKHLWLSLLLGLVVLVWAYPALIDRDALARFIELLRVRYYNVESDPRDPNWMVWFGGFWLRYAHLAILLVLALGLPLLVWLTERRTLALFFVVGLVLYVAAAGGSKHSIDRTMLPFLPALLLGALGWWLLIDRYVARAPAKWALVLLTVGPVFISFTFHSLRYNFLVTRKDTRELAVRWLMENAPSGSTVAIEKYGPMLPRGSAGHYLGEQSQEPGAKRRIFVPRDHNPLYRLSPRAARNRKLDYLVVSMAFKPLPPEEGLTAWRLVRQYRKLLESFPQVAVFEANWPPVGVLSLSKGAYATSSWGDFVNWELFKAWRQADSYVLGPPVYILQVGGTPG